MVPDELKRRTKQFSFRILKLVEALPKTLVGRAVGGQLVRSGSSAVATYRSTCRARSRAEIIGRVGVVEEEADESAFWLEVVIEHGLLPAPKVEPLLREVEELTAIMGSSRKSASRPR